MKNDRGYSEWICIKPYVCNPEYAVQSYKYLHGKYKLMTFQKKKYWFDISAMNIKLRSP